MVAAMSLSSKTRWDPGCGLRQDWDRKSLQADPGRLQTCGRGVRVSRGLGLLFQGLWCLSAGESGSQPRWEVAVVMRRVEKGREAPRDRRAGRPCCGCDSWLLPRAALRGLPEPGDTSCVIISIAVRYILPKPQHSDRPLPKWHMSQRPGKEKGQAPHSGGGRASGRPGAQPCTPHTGHRPLCGQREGAQLHVLGLLICDLGVWFPPCQPLSEDELRWTCVGRLCQIVTK